MSKLFYDHLIVMEEVVAVLAAHHLGQKEQAQILSLMDQTLQHEILDIIFTYLPEDVHGEFLQRFHASPGDPQLMQFIRDHADVNIELAILDRANKTKTKLLKEVEKATL